MRMRIASPREERSGGGAGPPPVSSARGRGVTPLGGARRRGGDGLRGLRGALRARLARGLLGEQRADDEGVLARPGLVDLALGVVEGVELDAQGAERVLRGG